MIFFFLLIRRLFNSKVALLASAFLAFLPAYLFRTLTGVSDKEAYGMLFMYLALYLYVVAWQSKSIKKGILFGALAGLATGLMTLGWNGANFVYFLIALSALIAIVFDKFTKKDVYMYASWLLVAAFMLFVFRFGIKDMMQIFTSFMTGSPFFVLFAGIIILMLHSNRFAKLKEKIQSKLPIGLFSLISAFVLVTILTSVFIHINFIYDKFIYVINSLIHPFGLGRLTLTVAESYQPYFTDWKGSFGWFYFLLFTVGSVYLFYNIVKHIKKYKWYLTGLYVIFLIGLIFSRYSSGAKYFNGVTSVANFVYIGSIILFVGVIFILYLYSFYKNKELFNELTSINLMHVFVFVLFFLTIVGARGAIRLLFVLAPVTAILAGYLIIEGIDYSLRIKDKIFKIITLAIIVFLIFWPFGFYDGVLIKFVKTSTNTAKYTGLGYGQQWQYAMKWVRDSTEKDDVFSHWWDYGYWIQTGGERPTVLDGGNFIAYWDTLMARKVLTAPNETDALEFLKVHNVSYLLIDPSDIGKYTAYSSIGSDENYDRYSWVNVFTVDPSTVRETRNSTIYIYQGGTPFDEDFIYNGKLYPKMSAGIGAFIVPLEFETNNVLIKQPTAIIVYQNQQVEVPVECVYFNKQEVNFDANGLKGCLVFIPTVNDNGQMDNRGLDFPAGALYVSERGRRALWVQLYLMEKKSDYFKVVYNDENRMPLSYFRGEVVGPIKIWQVSYPDDIKIKLQYLNQTGPDFL